jgi:membrane-bound metal-dependent hydrolase YbcI (DUF457 family)
MGQLAANIGHRDFTHVLLSLVVVFLSAADS